MSDVKIIATKDAPAAIGPYVQGKVIGGFLFASGQIPLVPATGAMAEGGIAEQARQALNNVKALVEAAAFLRPSPVPRSPFCRATARFALREPI